VRVEPGEREAGQQHGDEPPSHRRGVLRAQRGARPRADRAPCREQAVSEQGRRADDADRGDQRRQRGQRGAGPGDAGGDEHHVGPDADRNDRGDVLAEQPLPEDERVLCADRDDQRQADAEAGGRGGRGGGHLATVGSGLREAQLEKLQHH
jgi:hypothetical protein